MNSYYDTKLKKSRLNILKKYKNFKFVKNNIENYKILKGNVIKFKPKIIIHLAAQAGVRYSLKNPDAYLQSNIIGTFNCVKASNDAKVQNFIFISTNKAIKPNSIKYENIFSKL